MVIFGGLRRDVERARFRESTMGIKIQIELDASGVACFGLEGALDADGYQELETAFEESFREGRYRYALDLSRLTHIASAGAGVLLNAASLCQDHGGGIVLVRPTVEVKEILDLLGFSQIVGTAASREEALARFLTTDRV